MDNNAIDPSLPPSVDRLLHLENPDTNLYCGRSFDIGIGWIYGGQLLAQSTMAAQLAAGNDGLHALHCHFLRKGDSRQPVHYSIIMLRDSHRTPVLKVAAEQGSLLLAQCCASFRPSATGLDYQQSLLSPAAGDTESTDRIGPQATAGSGGIRTDFSDVFPIEAEPPSAFNDRGMSGRQYWLRVPAAENLPQASQKALLACLSDRYLCSAVLPPAYASRGETFDIVSLNHALWFHRPFGLHRRTLFRFFALSSAEGRALVQGQFFAASGQLIATVLQECIFQDRRSKAE